MSSTATSRRTVALKTGLAALLALATALTAWRPDGSKPSGSVTSTAGRARSRRRSSSSSVSRPRSPRHGHGGHGPGS